MPHPDIPEVPADWTVWAFTDAHGVRSGFVAALQEAGIIDARHHWVAPSQTALVGCGDYLDRGGDVRGLVDLLDTLGHEAAAAGSAIHLAKGNHEVMPLMVRRGQHEWMATWLEYGGGATLEAFGCTLADASDPVRMAAVVDACAPGLFAWMEGLAEAVRWRDVLFVHGGLVPDHAVTDFGTRTEEHVWVRESFYDAAWDDPVFEAYRREGIDRVVFGHTPQATGPTPFHDGRSLNIDTNAVGDPRQPDGAVQEFTLLRLQGDERLDQARVVSIPTHAAPDVMGGGS